MKTEPLNKDLGFCLSLPPHRTKTNKKTLIKQDQLRPASRLLLGLIFLRLCRAMVPKLLGLKSRSHVLCTFLVLCDIKTVINIPIWQLFWSHLDLLQVRYRGASQWLGTSDVEGASLSREGVSGWRLPLPLDSLFCNYI